MIILQQNRRGNPVSPVPTFLTAPVAFVNTGTTSRHFDGVTYRIPNSCILATFGVELSDKGSEMGSDASIPDLLVWRQTDTQRPQVSICGLVITPLSRSYRRTSVIPVAVRQLIFRRTSRIEREPVRITASSGISPRLIQR